MRLGYTGYSETYEHMVGNTVGMANVESENTVMDMKKDGNSGGIVCETKIENVVELQSFFHLNFCRSYESTTNR